MRYVKLRTKIEKEIKNMVSNLCEYPSPHSKTSGNNQWKRKICCLTSVSISQWYN